MTDPKWLEKAAVRNFRYWAGIACSRPDYEDALENAARWASIVTALNVPEPTP